MRKLALAILLILSTGCESAKFKPWVSYGEMDGSNLGINEGANRFINSPFGEHWEVGIAFEFPLGPSSPQIVRFDWPDRSPRYPIPVTDTSAGWQPPAPVEKSTENRVLDTVKGIGELSDSTIFRTLFIAIVAVVLAAIVVALGWWGLKAWKAFKNGKKKPE